MKQEARPSDGLKSPGFSRGEEVNDETGDYTVSVALTDDVADNGRSTVEVLRRE